jgi:hypothetical protein
MSFVNHNSARRLAKRFLGNEGMMLGGVYLMLTDEEKASFFVMKKVKWLALLEY